MTNGKAKVKYDKLGCSGVVRRGLTVRSECNLLQTHSAQAPFGRET